MWLPVGIFETGVGKSNFKRWKALAIPGIFMDASDACQHRSLLVSCKHFAIRAACNRLPRFEAAGTNLRVVWKLPEPSKPLLHRIPSISNTLHALQASCPMWLEIQQGGYLQPLFTSEWNRPEADRWPLHFSQLHVQYIIGVNPC